MDIKQVYEYLGHITPVIISAIVALLLCFLFFWVFKLISRRTDPLLNQYLIKVRKPTTLIMMLSGSWITAEFEFENIGIWNQVFEVAFILTFSWLIIRSIAIGREILTRQYDISGENNLKARKVYTQIRVFERIMVVITLILGVALSLMTFESIRNLGASIIASAGIAGILIGFASQKLIANLLAGFQIAITQPIRIDDVVIIENEWGRIEEITLTYVVVNIWDKRRLIIPSTQFIEKPFQNWTRTSAEILGTVFVHVDYKFPVAELRKKLTSILKDTPLWDGKVDVLQVTNLNDKTMELRALMSAKDSSTAWDLRVLVRERIIEFLQKDYPDCLPKSRVELDASGNEKALP